MFMQNENIRKIVQCREVFYNIATSHDQIENINFDMLGCSLLAGMALNAITSQNDTVRVKKSLQLIEQTPKGLRSKFLNECYSAAVHFYNEEKGVDRMEYLQIICNIINNAETYSQCFDIFKVVVEQFIIKEEETKLEPSHYTRVQ
ncbi:hypothetical protein EIN_284110 [Entamoeba invadens IP1]|uniref:Uncharacterized protein n=1 Tax=Entamoeba invadens IP1 TaxID=370355 RepID=L7FJY1_ENTIV|nr:hypothetical protein EIN_284110 [Entamoeba invadens IP1]ELP84855.1 hypothetical protein EIN_284110 [Entamoeba invadens IP1]|eukprot:XP_004184201.1 hypothetical protein EIN_284110 [Entamoeba invadens IP1]